MSYDENLAKPGSNAIQAAASVGGLLQPRPPRGMAWVPGQCHQHSGSPAATHPGTSTPTPHLMIRDPLLLFQGSGLVPPTGGPRCPGHQGAHTGGLGEPRPLCMCERVNPTCA